MRGMTDALSHRGIDGGGIWQDPDIGCVLGHRRLSIIDVSDDGAQPMESPSGRYMIVFNGEIYNFQSIRRELEAHITFNGRSDTEVMLAAIEIWGLNQALQKFNGMFAFALWDRQERVLHFARDRLGKKPLYIGWAGKTLVFGSELKALCAYPEFAKMLCPKALALYFRSSAMSAPYTIYKNVWSLKPAHRLKIAFSQFEAGRDLSSEMEPYWDGLDVLSQARLQSDMHSQSDEDVIAHIEGLIGACVEERMISDVPLGAFLSGGIDSSLVVSLMQKYSAKPVQTYTIGFDVKGFNEADHAAKIAQHLGTDHHAHILRPQDALDVIPHLSSMFDEPFADISAIPTYLVSKFARQSVTVALSGDGGDEMFGGYNRHVLGPKIWARTRYLPKPLKHIIAAAMHTMPTRGWDMMLPFLPSAGTRIHKAADIFGLHEERDIYERLSRTWFDTDDILLGRDGDGGSSYGDAGDAGGTYSTAENLEHLEHLSFAEKMMIWDTLGYLPDDILVKADRASMAVSLEMRAPLLDQKIFAVSWSLPERFKIRHGKGKWILREILARHVPRALFERPKQGFTMPVGDWLRGDLRDWAETLLDAKAIAHDGILNAAMVQKIWHAHLNGQGNHTQKLWSVLMFQSWKQKWMP